MGGVPKANERWLGGGGGWAQFLNMSQSSFSMGVLPMVRRKKSSSTRSEERKRSAGRSSSSFPNLGDRRGGGGWCHHPQCPRHPLGMGTAVPDGLPRVVGAVVLAQHHLRLVLQVLYLLGVLQAAGFCEDSKRWGRGTCGQAVGDPGMSPHLA